MIAKDHEKKYSKVSNDGRMGRFALQANTAFLSDTMIIRLDSPVLLEEFAIQKVEKSSLFGSQGVMLVVGRLQCNRTKGSLSLLAPCP
jgi:hypothetical protein